MNGIQSATGLAHGVAGGEAGTVAGARWAEAAATASAPAPGATPQEEGVALILHSSPQFASMLEQLGKDWSINMKPGLEDGVDKGTKTINVRSETLNVGGIVFDQDPATAGKVASAVAGVLRDRDVADIAKPGPKEAKAQFVARYKEGLAEADTIYNVRLMAVSKEVYAQGVQTSLAAEKEKARLGLSDDKPLQPIVVPVRSDTPGVTDKEIAQWLTLSDTMPPEKLGPEIKAELLRNPATSNIYQARADEAYKAATTPTKKP